MFYCTILIMVGALPEESFLVQNVDKRVCGDKADILFQEKCIEKGMKFSPSEMSAWQEAGSSDCLNGNNDYEIYIIWPTSVLVIPEGK